MGDCSQLPIQVNFIPHREDRRMCTVDDDDQDETEDDTGLLRIGNLILCSKEEWLRRKLLQVGPRILAPKLMSLDRLG
jgi:hypothetical protein